MIKMKVITDQYKFYVPTDYPDHIVDYPLIDWCKQYLTPNTSFVDEDPDVGFYSIVLSKYCKSVVTDLDKISKTIALNNITNINNQCDNVSFLKISSIDAYKDLLQQNNYPPFIFPCDIDKALIKSMQYKIHDIMGYPHIMLASDNPQYFKKNNIEAYEDVILSFASLDRRQNALQNAFSYMSPISYIKKINLNCPMGLRVPNNPSIIQMNENYLLNIRCSNYVYDPYFRFLEGNIHLSDHHLLTLDANFNIIKTEVLKDVTNNIYYDSFVRGIDDLRLIDNQHFLCSHGNLNDHQTIQQCLGTFVNGNVTSLIPLLGPDKYRHEKNWLPFMNNGLYMIYMINPFILYKYDQGLIKIKEIKLSDKNLDFRGSAPPIPYKNGWLATAHQVANMQYYHRFIWFDLEFTTIKYSIPFYFEIQGIEFNLGMCHSPQGLVMTYSVWDNHPKLIIVDYNVIDHYLQ